MTSCATTCSRATAVLPSRTGRSDSRTFAQSPDAAARSAVRRGGRRSVVAPAREATAPAVTAAAGRALPGLAHVERPALEVLAVELGDRLLRLAGRAHLDEPEAARLPGGAIGDDGDRLARPGLREHGLQVLARGVEGKVADEDLLAHLSLLALRGRHSILSRLPGREADGWKAAGSRTNKRTL